MDDPKWIKFEKRITINADSINFIQNMSLVLFQCIKETNEKHNVSLEYFRLELIPSEKNPFSKDLVSEWENMPIGGK